MKKHSGFTLLEVLVALAIVGAALPALLLNLQGMLDGTSDINTRTYAYWLAENKMQEMFITQKLQGNVVKTRKRQDSEEFAGQEWFWLIEVKKTEVEKMHRLEISVGLQEDEPLASLAGFIYE